MSIPQVYDREMRRLAFLENASGVSYDLPLNSLWTAGFTLPIDDPKNEYCEPFHNVEIYDGEVYIGLFRIIGQELTRSDDSHITYNCEHVLASLLNNVLFRHHQVGSAVTKTRQVLEYILAQQSVQNWVLGDCDFEHEFGYDFENQTLFEALLSVPACFEEDYVWEYDTSSYPWTISLKSPSEDLAGEIRYAKNLLGITRNKDASRIANRIYALGNGEGDNQLGIESIRTIFGNRSYVEDPESVQEYGVQESIIVDSRYTDPLSLYRYTLRKVRELSQPYYSYEVQTIDLFRLTGDESGRFWPGSLIRVLDDEDGITLRTRVVNVSKPDVGGDPGNITVTLANKGQDIAGSISDLQSRVYAGETVGQGATNLISANFADNGGATHPAVLKVWIPSTAVRINSAVLSVDFEPYRITTADGIIEGSTATSAAVAVDGQAVSLPSLQDVDIIDYLAKDSEDKITRDTWHTVEIAPNAPSRVVAALHIQIFINSRGGGDY